MIQPGAMIGFRCFSEKLTVYLLVGFETPAYAQIDAVNRVARVADAECCRGESESRWDDELRDKMRR